jgi:RNA polymerase sigma-70 factor (ECF subfamily)
VDNVDEAMSRYARGDATAFDAVYDAIAPRLARYLRRRVPDQARREDILQQTFLQMHCARGTFVAGAQVMPWAFSIARRLVIDAGRAGQRESHVELEDDRLVSQAALAARAPTSEEEVAAREAGARLARALTKVSEPQRAAFELVKTEGLSHAQAAAVLGTSVTGIKLRLHRVYVVLRGALDAGEKPRPIPRVTAFHGFETREQVVATPRLPHSAGQAPAQKEKRHAKHDHDPGRSCCVVRSRRAGLRPAEEAVSGRS